MTLGHEKIPQPAVTTSATVAAAASSITLAAPANVVYGQAATFTATVTGFGPPTGTVTFYSGPANPADEIGTGTLSIANGFDQAAFTTSSLSVSGSPRVITAVYSGNADNLVSASTTVNLTITPAPLTITANSESMSYGGTLPGLTVSFTGLVNGDTPATFAASANTAPTATTVPATSHAGTYAITPGGAFDPNYTISYATGTLTVNPDAFTYTIGNDSQTYGTAANLGTVLGTTINTGVNGQTLGIAYSSSGDTSTADAATYSINGALSGGTGLMSDYSVTLISGALTVNKYAFAYTIGNDSQTYGTAANLVIALGTTISTGVNGQSLAIAYTSSGDTNTAHAGTYNITGALSNGTGLTSDYAVTLSSGTLTVNKYAFAYTIPNDTQTYGAAANLVIALGATINTGVNGQNLAIAYSSSGDTSAAHAGTYNITGALSNGTGLTTDYAVTLASGTLTVNKYAFAYTIANDTQTYGAAANLVIALGTTINTGVNGQNLAIAYSSSGDTSSAHAGTYNITGALSNGTGLTTDYAVTLTNGTLTVKPAPLSIKANNQTKVYGQAVPTLTVSYSGFVSGDNSSSLTTQPATTTTATTSSPVGTYSITANGAVDPNYTITYVAGTLSVNQDATTTTATVSSTNSPFGQAVTLTAAVSAKPPGSGTPTGTVDFFDATTGVDLGKLALASGSARLSTTALSVGSHSITVSYSGDSNFVASATSASTITIGQSIIVLDPTSGGALSISGNANIKLTGGVYVDSSSSSAIVAGGNAQISAAVIDVHGSVSKSGNASFSPAPVTKATSTSDPLAGLPVPSTTGLKNYGSYSLSGNSTATISPGIYSKIVASGNANLTLSAGTYIIEGGGFSASGNANVTGTGVMIFNIGSGSTFGAITMSGNGTYKLTPPSTGPYANVLVFQPAANTQVLSYSGNAMAGVTGTIYAPGAQLVESGNAQVNAAIIVDTLTLSGNAISNVAALAAPQGTVAYTPAQLRTAYGVSALSLDGTGETIAIVDAYDNPSIYPALDAFDTQFGAIAGGPSLYGQYGPAASFLTVLNQDGQNTSLPSADPDGLGTDNWEVEESLDVEWAHALAPGAKIVLVETDSQSLENLMAGVATAANEPGVSVVSMSWGFAEGQVVSSSDEAAFDSVLSVAGVTFLASTGDYGAADPEYPAFSPNVVAVGGTTLSLNANSSYQSEIGWGYFSSSQGTLIGSGGGISEFEAEPSFQQGVQSTGTRTTPDVSIDADPATGAWIADSYNATGSNPFEVVGGTSLSAPAWAGLLALVNQGRAAAGQSALNAASPTEAGQALYSLPQSDYNVTSGGNNGYTGGAGYNLVTGLGSPAANLLVPDLVAYQGASTSYSGPKVGPLQNKVLDSDGSSDGGVADAFNVFDFLIAATNGRGYTQGQSASAGNHSLTGAMPAGAGLDRAGTTGSSAAASGFGSPTGSFSVYVSVPASSTPTSLGTGGLLPVTPSQVVTVAMDATGGGPARQLAGPAESRRGNFDSVIGSQEARWQDEDNLFVATRRSAVVPDWLLDDLVTGRVTLAAHQAGRALSVPGVSFVTEARSGEPGARSAGPSVVSVPAGPLPRSEPGRPSGGARAGLADLLLVGGFCGFGAGLMAIRHARGAGLRSKWSFIDRQRPRYNDEA